MIAARISIAAALALTLAGISLAQPPEAGQAPLPQAGGIGPARGLGRGGPPPPPQLTPEQVKQLLVDGERVFDQSCSNQYCHGPGGRGAMGPRLANVPIMPETVNATIREGRVGTPMVSFKNALEPEQLNAVIAYTLSISSGGRITQLPPANAAGPTGLDLSTPSTVPVAVGGGMGTPSRGAELFFDANRLTSCRTCHSYNRRGGPLGVDFADAGKTAPEILAALGKPRILARGYPVITVVTEDGKKVTGIRGRETEELLQIYDVMVPPVRRSIAKSAITEVQAGKRGLYDHGKLGLSRQQQLDLAALLGTRDAK